MSHDLAACLRVLVECLVEGDEVDCEGSRYTLRQLHEDRTGTLVSIDGLTERRVLLRDCSLRQPLGQFRHRKIHKRKNLELLSCSDECRLDAKGNAAINRSRVGRVDREGSHYLLPVALSRPVPSGLVVTNLRLSTTGMDQGWGNTGDSGLLVYLRRGDDSDEALMSITYDRRRSSRHQHDAVSEVPRGPYAPESGDCFHVVLRCPNYPGWSAYCKDVKLAVDCEEQVEEELSWSVSNRWQDQQEKAFFRMWAALAQDDYLTLDLSHLSLAGQQRQHVWNVVETDTTPQRSLVPRFEALLRKRPVKNTETRDRALRLLQKLQSNEQVMGAPTQAHERSRRYAELVALVHRTFDRLDSDEGKSEMFEAVMQQYADCVDDCIYRWEREIHNMHDLVTGDVTGEGALEAEDEVLRVLYRYRRQMAEGVLHHTKGSNDMADMHFESHFYASVHFGLAEQRTARKDPHRLTYLSLNNRVRPEDLQAQLFKEYVPAKLRQILREEIFESKGSGTQALREKMTNWLSAHIPHAFRPSEGVEQRREAWLYQWCHDEEFRITNEALNYMLCCMHIISAVPLILQAAGHDVGAADVLPHGVPYVGPAVAAPTAANASRSSPRTGAGCIVN